MYSIGQRIREHRKKNLLTQEQLADMLGVTFQSVSKWERGTTYPDLSMIGPITRALSITSDELLGLVSDNYDAEHERHDAMLKKYRDSEDHGQSYAAACDAVRDCPDEDSYLEWQAMAEYKLALAESVKPDGDAEFMEEMIENSNRHFEFLVENCTDPCIYKKAVLGKILTLYFSGRETEADWSAEFEYPASEIKTAKDALRLLPEGVRLREISESENKEKEIEKQIRHL